MKPNRLILSLFIPLSVFITGCFEEDTRVEVPELTGNVDTLNNHIEEYFSYYDLETQTTTGIYTANCWELGFESSTEGYRISLNSATSSFIANSGNSEFNQALPDQSELNWKWDNQAYFPDSTAIGEWFSVNEGDTLYHNKTYVLGSTVNTTDFMPEFEIKLLKVDAFSYRFAISTIGNDNIDTFAISKIPNKSFVYYSIKNAETVLEPDVDEFDIVFGPYYEGLDFNQSIVPYFVRGVLLNPENTRVYVDSINTYKDITYSTLIEDNFSSTRNIIGHEWKNPTIDFESGKAVYTIRSDYTYIIETSMGSLYKFRFIGYALKGENGYPSYQFEKLEYND